MCKKEPVSLSAPRVHLFCLTFGKVQICQRLVDLVHPILNAALCSLLNAKASLMSRQLISLQPVTFLIFTAALCHELCHDCIHLAYEASIGSVRRLLSKQHSKPSARYQNNMKPQHKTVTKTTVQREREWEDKAHLIYLVGAVGVVKTRQGLS